MSVFAPALGVLWKQLEEYGIDPEPVFRAEGVDPETMFDSGARISMALYQRIDEKVAQLSRDPFFAFRGAEHFRPAHLGALGFAWLASCSLRTAFERMSRYARVIQENLMVELDEDDAFFYVRIDARLQGGNEKIREDRQLSLSTKLCRVIYGDSFSPAKICFQQKSPVDTSYHYEFFRCPLEFEAAATTFVIHLKDVDKRLTGSNDELARLNEHIVVKYLAHSAKNDVVNRVKAAIIDGLANGVVTEAFIAEGLHTTSRNLHRKLLKENTSFKQLLNEIRRDLALQYIQDRSKTLTEISFMLGFSEASSFSRAFKTWTGKPPSEARLFVA
jgi:AraC-like DNA-binding protein